MIYYVDVDGTICSNTQGKYEQTTPWFDRIEKINQLYDEGHTIIYWTARGATTGIDWTDLTKEQLKKWGAKHHDVLLNKPHFDVYICDKSHNSEKYF